MTGGTCVVLGPFGYNLGAGMTGGQAFVFDPDGLLSARLNAQLVEASKLDDPQAAELRFLLERHREFDRIGACSRDARRLGHDAQELLACRARRRGGPDRARQPERHRRRALRATTRARAAVAGRTRTRSRPDCGGARCVHPRSRGPARLYVVIAGGGGTVPWKAAIA